MKKGRDAQTGFPGGDDALLEATCLLEDAHRLHGKKRFVEAAKKYRRASRLQPDNPHLHYDLGCCFQDAGAIADAADAFGEAIRILEHQPDTTGEEKEKTAHALNVSRHNRANMLYKLGFVDESVAVYEENLAHSGGEASLSALATVIPGAPASSHGAVRGMRERWAESLHEHAPGGEGSGASDPGTPDRAAGEAIRVGYLSSHLTYANWMKPVWALINHHDRNRVQVHLIGDVEQSKIDAAYRAEDGDRYLQLKKGAMTAARDAIAELNLDILIDLNAYSDLRWQPLFLEPPAKVAAGWFNHYATSGLPGLKYLIGDDQTIDPEEESEYTESIVRLPMSYLTFRVDYPVPGVEAAPCLGGGGITFGSMCSQYKITPQVVETWAAILKRSPDSTRLVLRNAVLSDDSSRRRLLDRFREHGISAKRLSLLGRADHFEFLETYGQVDIALDVFPYNGGTTTTEALWQGVPVIAFRGDRWASRTSASIIAHTHLAEFLKTDLDGYIESAVALANDPETPARLDEIRRNMRERLLESSVCDAPRFAREMEALYEEMIGR